MYGYNIFLTSGQTIEGEIENVAPVAALTGHNGMTTSPVTITDTEGDVVVNPSFVSCVSYWKIKGKSNVGFRE